MVTANGVFNYRCCIQSMNDEWDVPMMDGDVLNVLSVKEAIKMTTNNVQIDFGFL